MSIVLSNLTKSFGTDLILDDVTEEIPSGSLTALLGPSGSGKSTLLRVIAGLEPLDAGTVRLHGRDVTRVAARERRIGFCFQDYAPFHQMTVSDNVAYGLKVRRVPGPVRRDEVRELLRLTRLSELADRYPRQLSGGQRQRMALARALAIKPEVLLLDEPFAALDAQVGAELREWVRSLQREVGITTLLVTHNQNEAMEVADRLVILNGGRIEQTGAPEEVYDKPATPFVHAFLGPLTTWQGRSVRPHELQLGEEGVGHRARVVDIVRLGFEVRVVVEREGETSWLQLTHHEARQLSLVVGSCVWVRPR